MINSNLSSQVITIPFKVRIFGNRESDIKVTVWSSVVTRISVPRQLYFLPVMNSGRDGNPDFLAVDVKCLLMRSCGISQMKLQFRRNILPPEFPGGRATCIPEAAATTEHALEEIRKIFAIAKIST